MKMLRALFLPTTLRAQLRLCVGLAATALSLALISQYGFHLHPCELCLYQRYPYAAIIALGMVGMFIVKSPRAKLFFVYLCTLLFFVDGGIAAYHSGVELDIFIGPDACSSAQTGEQTLEEMRAAILGAPLVSCKQAMAYFFGLSMATWNMIFAFGVGGFMTMLVIKNRKNMS